MPAHARPDDFGILASGYRRRLLSYFKHRLANRDDAEDLAQEVLTQVCAADFSKILRFEAYVFGIASNVLNNQLRKNALRRTFEPEHGRKISEDISGQIAIDPERVLISRLLLGQVEVALLDMPKKTRDIFILFKIHGMPQKQIAAEYAISLSSVEKHIVKASVILAKRVTHR